MKLKQVIPFLFAGLVLLNPVHNAIPHHHHHDDMFSHEGCEDQCCDMADIGTGEPCTHCHAFNGMQYFPVTENMRVLPLKHLGNDFLTLPSAYKNLYPGMSQGLFAFTQGPDHPPGPERKQISPRGPPSTF